MSFPRTLIVTNDFPPQVGGVERFVFDLADRLPPDRIRVLAPRQSGDVEFDDTLDFPVERLPRGRILPPKRLRRRIAEAIRAESTDVVLFGHALPLGVAGPLVASLGVPYALLTHGAEYWLAQIPPFSYSFRYATSRASRVFVISTFTGRTIRRVVPAGVPMVMLPPGVDTKRFRPDIDGAWVRRVLAVADRPMILSVSRMVPRKGQDVLIDALPLVQRAVPEAVLVLVGDGADRATLEGRVSSARLGPSIVFAGEVTDENLPSFYAAADVFATPCRTRWHGLEVEGFGIVFLEAASSGLPSVAGDSGGAAEAVVHGVTGLVVDGADPRPVADALIGMLTDGPRATSMGHAARARAETTYDWELIVERLSRHLREIAA
jgi:phosphatidyl-myo-inositol dimannoside synthase